MKHSAWSDDPWTVNPFDDRRSTLSRAEVADLPCRSCNERKKRYNFVVSLYVARYMI